MKTLMYPIAPEDDFPEMFCAIRPYDGEHQFYTPEGEDASWMLFRAESENAKLRGLCADMLSEDMDQHWPEFTRRALELGVEVDK